MAANKTLVRTTDGVAITSGATGLQIDSLLSVIGHERTRTDLLERYSSIVEPQDIAFTDDGNAQRMVLLFDGVIKYVKEGDRWFIWNGAFWQPDSNKEIGMMTIGKIISRLMMLNEYSRGGESSRIPFITYSGMERGIRSMISLSRSETSVQIAPSELDAHPFFFNVNNGTLDLRSGDFYAHNPSNLMTKTANVDFLATAVCPTFDNFLRQVTENDEDLALFLQKVFGYALTGDNREQVFFNFFGGGKNGKSTLVNLFVKILGDYAEVLPVVALLRRNNDSIPNDIAMLPGKRLVVTDEIDQDRKLNESLVKTITGGDQVSARYLHKEFFSFQPECKLIIPANHLPQISGKDEGIWRRTKVVPFLHTVPKENRDMELPEKLLAEGSGILNWAIQGCTKWLDEQLGTCDAVEEATRSFHGDMDRFSGFVGERCVTGTQHEILAKKLKESYDEWATGDAELARNDKSFSRELKDRGLRNKKTNVGQKWFGIALKP
jgi:putative DNA primase/helicase